MAEGSSARREAEKAWRQRNSDGRATFEGERYFPPPAFSLEDHDLPTTPLRITTPDEEGSAVRHVHVYGVDDPGTSTEDAITVALQGFEDQSEYTFFDIDGPLVAGDAGAVLRWMNECGRQGGTYEIDGDHYICVEDS